MNEPVEVAGWLLPWWEFWHGITKALWWPAWSALFSAAALSATIFLANGNARRERRRDAAFIEAAATLADLTLASARSVLRWDDSKLSWEEKLDRLAGVLDDGEFIALLRKVDITKFPTSKSLRAFITILVQTSGLEDIAKGKANDRSPDYLRSYVVGAEFHVRAMWNEARRLSGGRSEADAGTHLTKDPIPTRRGFDPRSWFSRD